MILYSVIIPHYNDVDSLKVLLHSIPLTRDDVQVIVVDDNTYEDHGTLEEQLSEYKQSIELYWNPSQNHSAGACRNVGLEHAKGKWLLFADADDWYVKGAFDILDQHADEDSNIIFFLFTSINLPEGTRGVRHIEHEEIVKGYIKNPKTKYLIKYKLPHPVAKLIDHQLVKDHKIQFDQTMCANDVMFSLKAARYAERISAYDKTIYCATRKQGTLTTNKSYEEYKERFEIYLNKWTYLRDFLPENVIHRIMDWPGNNIVYALKFGYGYQMVRYILDMYKNNRIKIGFQGISIKRIIRALKAICRNGTEKQYMKIK